MYVKKCTRTYKKKEYIFYWLVESYRENHKVKTRYLCDISKVQKEKILKIKKILGEK